MKQISEILSAIDLGPMEIRAYLSLLELQEAKTGNLCKHAKIASSNIYRVLDILLEKGLVSYRLQNNVKIFMPNSPENLKNLYNEKQKNLVQQGKEVIQIINSLKKLQVENKPYSNYKYFEGISGIKSLWIELQENIKPKMILYTFVRTSVENHPLRGFFTDWHNQRIRKKANIKMIFPTDSPHGKKRSVLPFTEVKFLKYTSSEAEWGIVGDYLYIEYVLGKQPRGFLIKDEIFSQTFKIIFEQLWEKAKK